MSEFAYNLVLNTPTDFSCVLLDKWIDPKDLVNLDTAFCTMSCRSNFLDLLQADEFVMSSTKSCPLRSFGLFGDWIMKRQVKLSHVDLGHGSNPVDLSKIDTFIGYCAPNLRSIYMVSLRMTAISDDGYDPIFHIVATHCRSTSRTFACNIRYDSQQQCQKFAPTWYSFKQMEYRSE